MVFKFKLKNIYICVYKYIAWFLIREFQTIKRWPLYLTRILFYHPVGHMCFDWSFVKFKRLPIIKKRDEEFSDIFLETQVFKQETAFCILTL